MTARRATADLAEFLAPSHAAMGDVSNALEAAMQSAHEVRIGPGVYLLSRPLRVPSQTRLFATPETRIRLAAGAATEPGHALLSNANPSTGDADIEVCGGVWDGNNTGNPRPSGLFDMGYSGALMHFENVRSLRVQGLEVTDAEAYYIRLTKVSAFCIRDIGFNATTIRHNNDGVHLGGFCEDGEIANLRGLRAGVTGDDMVALNADDALERCEVRGMLRGPIRRIRISGIRAEGCHSFVRLLSVTSPIEDISIADVEGTCEVSAINCDAARGCRVPVFDPNTPPFPDGVGILKNIHAQNFRVGKASNNDVALLRLETRMENFLVEDFVRTADGAPLSPTYRLRHIPGTLLQIADGPTLRLGEDEEVASPNRLGRLLATRSSPL